MLTSRKEGLPVGAFPRPDLVPYITQWSAEKSRAAPRVVVRRDGLGIGYAGERPYDRDGRGVLWNRVPSVPGKGRPEFGKVHDWRQVQAMERLLCQVCGRDADRNADGVLWLLGEDPNTPGSWPVPLTTTHPPLCISCAMQSIRLCPHLRKRYAALRVRAFDLWGIHGALYRQGASGPVAVETGVVAFGEPLINWMRAGQLVMCLREFTIIDLAAEEAEQK
jgi:hypothetical protein